MEDSNEDTRIERAKANARLYIEYTRWNSIGPVKGKIDKKDADYLLCLGSYQDIDINPSTLGKIFGEAPVTVSGRLKGLEIKGFIEREQSLDDKREKIIALTEKGAKKYLNICMFLDGNSRENPLDIDSDGLVF